MYAHNCRKKHSKAVEKKLESHILCLHWSVVAKNVFKIFLRDTCRKKIKAMHKMCWANGLSGGILYFNSYLSNTVLYEWVLYYYNIITVVYRLYSFFIVLFLMPTLNYFGFSAKGIIDSTLDNIMSFLLW